MQELLRRTQALEKQKRDLEVANQALAAAEAAGSAANTSAGVVSAKELTEMRLLNEQLIERLGNERAEHAQSKSSLASALEASKAARAEKVQIRLDLDTTSRENEILSIRLEQLVDQLYALSTRNDMLQQELAETAQSRKSPHLEAACVESDSLHHMS